MPARLIYLWKAEEDLADIYRILSPSNAPQARQFLRSIEARCESLLLFPRQGWSRDDLLPGIRTLPYARAVAYRIKDDDIVVERVFWKGQDYEALLRHS